MAMAPLMSAIHHSIRAGAVRSGFRAGIAWETARTADDLAADAWFGELDEFIDGVPASDDCRTFLRFLVRVADGYVACLADTSGDPKQALTRLLSLKGVHLTRLLARMSRRELIELITALHEFLNVLPDRLEHGRLGAIFGTAAAVTQIADDLLAPAHAPRPPRPDRRQRSRIDSCIAPRPIHATPTHRRRH